MTWLIILTRKIFISPFNISQIWFLLMVKVWMRFYTIARESRAIARDFAGLETDCFTFYCSSKSFLEHLNFLWTFTTTWLMILAKKIFITPYRFPQLFFFMFWSKKSRAIKLVRARSRAIARDRARSRAIFKNQSSNFLAFANYFQSTKFYVSIHSNMLEKVF